MVPMMEEKNKKDMTLYIMTDGAMVNTRIEDEKGSTYREAKTAMAFTDKDIIRRKDDSKTILKKEYCSYMGSAEEFRKYVLQIAIKSGYGKTKKIVILGDGASWIRTMCEEIFPDAVQILDLYHLKENIYDYAKYLHGESKEKYTQWSESMIDKITEGKVSDALSMIPDNQSKMPSGTVNIRTYIENNIDKINYKEYKKQGYYIGSGPIESANKTIVQRRLKQSGMRWSLCGAQSILMLRAKVEGDRWYEVESILCA
jgi:hypothetical protein